MGHEKKIYLSKNGKAFGPFAQVEVDDLSKRGELDKFSWICVDLKKGWIPLHSPPPLPSEESDSGVSQNVARQEIVQVEYRTDSILALCHNYRLILSGSIKEVNAEGCTLTHVSPESKSMPLFKGGSRVYLSLLNSKTQESQNLDALVKSGIKNNGFWDYRISWDKIPTLLYLV